MPQKTNKTVRLLCAALLCAGLAACGGGEGDDGGNAGADGAGTGGAGSADPSSTAVADHNCALPDFKAEALRLVNERRAAGASCGARGAFAPTGPLQWNDKLLKGALVHSRDMAGNNFFSHTGSNGSTPGQRATAAGYAWRGVGENIAGGYGAVSATVEGWMRSDGHCAILMNPGYLDMGLACVNQSASTYKRYWTLLVATPE